MTAPLRHVLRQGPVIRTVLKVACLKALPGRGKSSGSPRIPGPILEDELPPRNPRLVRDYILHVGGDQSWYAGVVPAHMFPQWGFPILFRTLDGQSYDISRVINVGCEIRMNRPLPAGERLVLSACLESVDDNGERAIIRQRVVTGTRSAPEAVVGYVSTLVPLKTGRKSGGNKDKPKKEKPKVPENAREIARWRLSGRSGLEFAYVTGDFNPMHWSRAYARAFGGHRGVILHGFAQVARAVESMNRHLFSGNPGRLARIEARFTAPLVIPGETGVFVDADGGFFVGAASGEPASLVGSYETVEGE
ncbi:MAG TPA: MaoC/PaaZ C-terminal domain-containing protein [Candidatus Brocadiia bacterium]|nr:MaoC/PaaZ C-terminal domain-containing protein [Candidatus Brocadiia bacterium]